MLQFPNLFLPFHFFLPPLLLFLLSLLLPCLRFLLATDMVKLNFLNYVLLHWLLVWFLCFCNVVVLVFGEALVGE